MSVRMNVETISEAQSRPYQWPEGLARAVEEQRRLISEARGGFVGYNDRDLVHLIPHAVPSITEISTRSVDRHLR